MEKIEFNLKNFGVLSSEIGWCNIYCPYCGKYNSQSFLFELKKDKKEYLGRCERCRAEVVIDMGSIEQNNKLLKIFENQKQRLCANGNKTLNEFNK